MGTRLKKSIVVSAINFTDGGPLSILRECLGFLSERISMDYNIIALVNNADIVNVPGIQYLEFPDSKKSWMKRILYEYYHFNMLSKRIKPFLWLSLHDVTPNVEASRRAVYCHNPAPFYNLSMRSALLDGRFVLFNMFYKYLYKINIKKNDYIIVQQNWIREEFIRRYKLNNVIVSYPEIKTEIVETPCHPPNKKTMFFYPTLARVFKNIEIVGESAIILNKTCGDMYEIVITIDGTENKYSRYIYNKYKHVQNINFIGMQSRREVYDLYDKVDCLIFPSKLETWGLPITEFKRYNKPIVLSNLKYAHETIGKYDKVAFFDPDNAVELADILKSIVCNTIVFQETIVQQIQPPFCQTWGDLFDYLLKQ